MNEAALPAEAARSTQAPLPLDALPLPPGIPLLPARMLNEYVYCPRLAYLEWVQGEWADSADTVEGRHVHRRVDKARGKPPKPNAPGAPDAAAAVDDAPPTVHVHSMELSSAALGLVARLDLAFGYAAQYRQIVEIQCRLLGRHLLGEIERYPNLTTR